MHGYNLVAIYPCLADAERVRSRLVSEGIPAANVRLGATAPEAQAGAASQPGFFDWLFGADVPETDRTWYGSNLRDGRTAVSVRAENEQLRDRAVGVMEEFDPIDLDENAMPERSGPAVRPSAGPRVEGTAASGRERVEEGERVIPVVKEEMSVGKRAAERRYRVRTYVVERPVKEQVTLRDERVEIEHRPVSGAAVGRAATLPQQKEMEIVERHEEPVVEKRGRTAEEVVVRKNVTERPQTVRGTVQETKVDVEKEPETAAPAGATTRPVSPRR